jgi:spore coat protein JB
MNRERINLLRRIQSLEFTTLELNLYLDTHPADQRALSDFNRFSKELHEANQEYESRYGPLVNFGHSSSPSAWKWINEPWPWEMMF